MPKETLDLIIPAEGMFDILPDDNNDLEQKTRGIYVGDSGNLSVRMVDGSEGVLGTLIAGMVHPLQVIRVFATGTTADDIRGVV